MAGRAGLASGDLQPLISDRLLRLLKATVEKQLAVNSRRLMVHKTDRHARGRRHGIDVHRERRLDLPEQVQRVFDPGLQGVLSGSQS